MSATPSYDHVVRGVSKLLQQYRQPKYEGWLTAYLNRIQEAEDATWEVIEGRNLADAEGKQLDVLGRIVGRGRNGLSDDRYRLSIGVKILVNRSNGIGKDFRAIMALSTPDDVILTYEDQQTATIVVGLGPGDYDLDTLRRDLKSAKAPGVKLFAISWGTGGTENAFTTSVDYGVATPDEDLGWGTVYDIAVGGYLTHVEVL